MKVLGAITSVNNKSYEASETRKFCRKNWGSFTTLELGVKIGRCFGFGFLELQSKSMMKLLSDRRFKPRAEGMSTKGSEIREHI